MINAFTVDVEDYFQVSGFEGSIDRNSWSKFESRVVPSTRRLLELLLKSNVRGTFFVLGWIADRYPTLVQEIDKCGHEIGSHSYWHSLVYEQTPAEFREDLKRSRNAIEDITGKPVVAYRAPSFSITQRSKWSLEILVEQGFTMDSSIFPIHHDRYGIPNAQRGPHILSTPSGEIWEFPPTVTRLSGMNIPVGGGGYFRLFPVAWTSYWLRRVQVIEQVPVMFYVHPWEIDADQPRLRAGGLIARFRHYVNLARTENKLNRLLSEISFGSMSEALTERFGNQSLNPPVQTTPLEAVSHAS
jgi:polysaccharide deacetylase family protein (PEP-CTERM system associated)